MAIDTTKIIVGAVTSITIGGWATAKGAGVTMTDCGALLGGLSLEPKREDHRIFIDQALGGVSSIPVKRELQLKFRMLEGQKEKWRLALGQPTANLTGTPPNETLVHQASAGEQYHQIIAVGKGIGTNKTRTMSFWRCVFIGAAPLQFKKDGEQAWEVTVDVLEELTGSGNDTFAKYVDT